jgi:uncharacterized repeat protein (TIGR03803 family)
MSAYGGVKNQGAIFSLPIEGGNPTILASFDGTNGARPLGGLTLWGSTLYGMTSSGGAHGKGAVFSLSIADGIVTPLASFDGANGERPLGDLTLSRDGTMLYGLTELGGLKNAGTIFRIPVRGGDPTVLASFEGPNGAQPLGGLVLDGSTLYGMTSHGGATGQGTIFSIPTSGHMITTLASFHGSNGVAPLGSLTLRGPTLYGMTWLGGANGIGTVFRIGLGGGDIKLLASFDGRNGAQPTGSLTLSGSTLYGTTNQGGDNDCGTVFRTPLDGGGIETLASFTRRDHPCIRHTLALGPDGATLYGMTTPDGAGIPGSVFAIPTQGRRSKSSTITDFMKPTPPPSWLSNVERLRQAVRRSVRPKPVERKPLSADLETLLRWSEPVAGLVARIESVWQQTVFFVRLKNVSDQPLTVPTGNSNDKKVSRFFNAFVQQGSSTWRRASDSDRYGQYFPPPPKPAAPTDLSGQPRLWTGQEQPADRPWITLAPGTSCIAIVVGLDEEDTGEAKSAKIVFRQTDTSDPARWNGVLETPPRPMELSLQQATALRASLPFPEHFPALSYDYSGSVNQGPVASAVEQLEGPNRPLIDTPAIYQPARVSKEFERRMEAEKVAPMKLLLASMAASAGSEKAAIFLLDTMKETEYRAVAGLHHALRVANWNCRPDRRKWEPPDWLVELCLAILSDHRTVTGPKGTGFRKGTSLTISSCETGHLIFALGESKCRDAVPLLVERVRRREADWDVLNALGQIGDARAAPALIEGVKQGYFGPEPYKTAVHALGKLKSRDAVPVLLEDIEYPETIDALGEIGDPRAVSALREIVAANGRIVRDGRPVAPEGDAKRFYAARLALTYLDEKDGALRLAEMLGDPGLERNQRYDVVLRLGRRSDPRTIPYLIRVIKTDSNYFTVDLAIGALAQFKRRAAVEGLIECFDVPFRSTDLGKGQTGTPELLRNRLARGLQMITGQPFGSDKQQWLRWWRETGSKTPEPK